MIYSNEENRRWWEALTKTDRLSLIEIVEEKANQAWMHEWTNRLRGKLLAHIEPTADDLARLRKWDR